MGVEEVVELSLGRGSGCDASRSHPCPIEGLFRSASRQFQNVREYDCSEDPYLPFSS